MHTPCELFPELPYGTRQLHSQCCDTTFSSCMHHSTTTPETGSRAQSQLRLLQPWLVAQIGAKQVSPAKDWQHSSWWPSHHTGKLLAYNSSRTQQGSYVMLHDHTSLPVVATANQPQTTAGCTMVQPCRPNHTGHQLQLPYQQLGRNQAPSACMLLLMMTCSAVKTALLRSLHGCADQCRVTSLWVGLLTVTH